MSEINYIMIIPRIILFISVLFTVGYLFHCIKAIMKTISLQKKNEPINENSADITLNPYLYFLRRYIKDNFKKMHAYDDLTAELMPVINQWNEEPSEKDFKTANTIAMFSSGSVFIGIFSLIYFIAKYVIAVIY